MGFSRILQTIQKFSWLMPILLVVSAAAAWGQTKKPATLAELAAYAGADRQQILLAGAKAEGKVVWYTSLAGSSYKELTKGFEAKYPGIKLEAYRAAGRELLSKVLAEGQAKQHLADAFESTLPLLKSLREERALTPYFSAHLSKYPASATEKADRGLIYWAVIRESYIGLGYNTSLIRANAVPGSFADLLKAEFKGKIGFATSDTGSRTLGAILKFKGEEFLKQFKSQEISLHSISGRAIADLVISGELALSPTVFREHALESKGKGAPIDWAPLDVVPTNAGGVSLSAHAPHPHAALLLVDFLVSPEGLKILEKLEFTTGVNDPGFKRWYPESGLNTAQYDKEVTLWQKLLRELGRK
jgi:iron(III) transport system substrate-binding protein